MFTRGEKAFATGMLVSAVPLGVLATSLALANIEAREQLSAELLEGTYGDCLPEEMASPELTEMSYSLLDRIATVNAPIEGDAPYTYELRADNDGGLVVIPSNDRTWVALSEADCEFPTVE